jgi:hypothetical protein
VVVGSGVSVGPGVSVGLFAAEHAADEQELSVEGFPLPLIAAPMTPTVQQRSIVPITSNVITVPVLRP